MQKTAPPKNIILSASEIAIAKKFGMTAQQYAEYKVSMQNPNWPMPEDTGDDYEENPNKIEIMNVPIKTLLDLWAVKFGNTWVDINELDDEWDRIFGRLDKYDLFEETNGDYFKLKDEL